jgi:hypothetical protein
MPANSPPNLALSDGAARQLANATKTTAQMSTISPRWLVSATPRGGLRTTEDK